MKAIQTNYNGYKFRSRLEARWAVFFDSIGLNWSYETEGYVLENGKYYLPDFTIYRLDKRKIHYEVKPKNYKDEINYAKPLIGDPYDYLGIDALTMCPRCGNIDVGGISVGGYEFEPMGNYTSYRNGEIMFNCHECDMETPFGTDEILNDGFLGDHFEIWLHEGVLFLTKPFSGYWYRLFHDSVIKARQARFEHGETP